MHVDSQHLSWDFGHQNHPRGRRGIQPSPRNYSSPETGEKWKCANPNGRRWRFALPTLPRLSWSQYSSTPSPHPGCFWMQIPKIIGNFPFPLPSSLFFLSFFLGGSVLTWCIFFREVELFLSTWKHSFWTIRKWQLSSPSSWAPSWKNYPSSELHWPVTRRPWFQWLPTCGQVPWLGQLHSKSRPSHQTTSELPLFCHCHGMGPLQSPLPSRSLSHSQHKPFPKSPPSLQKRLSSFPKTHHNPTPLPHLFPRTSKCKKSGIWCLLSTKNPCPPFLSRLVWMHWVSMCFLFVVLFFSNPKQVLWLLVMQTSRLSESREEFSTPASRSWGFINTVSKFAEVPMLLLRMFSALLVSFRPYFPGNMREGERED